MLLRVLEELVAGPEVRLHALEQVRSEGQASIEGVALSDAHVRKYGLGALSMHDPVEEVAHFLSRGRGRPFCHTCLTVVCSIEFDTIRKVVTVLRIRREFRVRAANCSLCRRQRVTIETVGGSAEGEHDA